MSSDGNSGSIFSLFPAYAQGESTTTQRKGKSDCSREATSWLKNASFVTADAAKIHDEAQAEEEPDSDQDIQKRSLIEKPQYVTSEESIDGDEQQEAPQSHHHKKKKKKEKKHKKHKKHRRKHDESPLLDKRPIPGMIPPVPGKVFIDDIPKQDDLVVFSLDKAPDKNNFIYDSIYKGNVAQHHTMRQCLGLGPGEQFSKPPKSGKRHGTTGGPERYYHLGSRKKKSKRDEKGDDEDVVMVDHELEALHPVEASRGVMPVLEEYLPLSDGKSDGNAVGSSVRKTLQEVGDKLSGETRADYIRRTTEEYNKRLAKNPHNIDLWLQFINFQDETFKDGGDLGIGKARKEIDRLKRQESLAFQMKQAIFERALRENPGCVKLKLEHLSICSDYLDQADIAKDWKELLFQHPNNLMVWQKHLEFAESRIGTFSVTKLLKTYKKCIHVLKGIESGQVLSHPSKPGTADFMMAIFVKLCYRLQQAGHMEKAVGLFQAQLEFNIFLPDSLEDGERERQMDFFTAFWESDAPRVGEDGARGWAQWITARGQVPPFVPSTTKQAEEELEESLQQEHTTKYSLWEAMETSRSSRHWLPWRPDTRSGETAESCEDPESLVLVDDVAYALFPLRTNQRKFQLLCHFLHFLGLPNPEDDVKSATSELCQVKASVHLENISQMQGMDVSQRLDGCDELNYENKTQFVKNVFLQMFPVFQRLPGLCDELFSLYLDFLQWMINMESVNQKNATKEAKAAAKLMLQEEQYRSNLFSWQQYALMEYNLGNLSGARKVLNNTITGLASNLDSLTTWHDRAMAVLLYRSYAEIELGLCSHLYDAKPATCSKAGKKLPNNPSQATHILVSMCEETFSVPEKSFAPSATQLLKCRRYFECKIQEHMDVFTPSLDMDNDSLDFVTSCVEHWVVCYTLFLYLTSGTEVAATTHQDIMCRLAESSEKLNDIQRVPSREESECRLPLAVSKLLTTVEKLTEVNIKLSKYNLDNNRAPLQSLRGPLEQAIDLYPENILFLSQYVSLELRSSFTGRLRQRLSRICRKTRKPQVWIVAIMAEITKIQKLQSMSELGLPQSNIPEASVSLPEIGLVHVVRTWFERAVTSCCGCVLLWRLYLQFEVKYGKTEAVKAIFYRAVQQCPWSKAFYRDYIATDAEYLEETFDLMTEKELRVHTPLEEIDILLEPSHTPPESPSS